MLIDDLNSAKIGRCAADKTTKWLILISFLINPKIKNILIGAKFS